MSEVKTATRTRTMVTVLLAAVVIVAAVSGFVSFLNIKKNRPSSLPPYLMSGYNPGYSNPGYNPGYQR